jgi:hypothetical protein
MVLRNETSCNAAGHHPAKACLQLAGNQQQSGRRMDAQLLPVRVGSFMPRQKDLWFEPSREAPAQREVSTEVAGVDRRSSPRMTRAQAVQVRGLDASGRYFSERTTTQDVSEGGCRLTLQAAVTIGAILRITIPVPGDGSASGPAAQFEVVWTRQQGQRCEVGARLVKGSSPWGPTTEPVRTALSGF